MNVKIFSLLITFGFAVSSQATLTGYWDFEEGSGSTVNESVSNTDSAAFGGGITFSTNTPGANSNFSLSFDGNTEVNTNVSGGDLNLPGTGAKTISLWFNSSVSEPIRMGLFGYTPTGGDGEDLRFVYEHNPVGGRDHQLRLEVSGGAATFSTGGLLDGNWHMVAAVIPAGAEARDIQFYINGTLHDEDGGSTRLVNTASGDDVFLGSTGGGFYFNGLMDDVRVYDSALTLSELDAIYTAIPEPGTLALLGIALGTLLAFRRRK